MSMRIGTAAAVLCGSFYLYVVCIVSEGGTLFLYVRVVRLARTFHPSPCQLLRPHRVHEPRKKTFVGNKLGLRPQ